jgi:hypothetical protein
MRTIALALMAAGAIAALAGPLSAAASARMYFVSPTGSDANSCEETPVFSGNHEYCRTLNHVAAKATWQDVIGVEAGEYAERAVLYGGLWIAKPGAVVRVGIVEAAGRGRVEVKPSTGATLEACFDSGLHMTSKTAPWPIPPNASFQGTENCELGGIPGFGGFEPPTTIEANALLSVTRTGI